MCEPHIQCAKRVHCTYMYQVYSSQIRKYEMGFDWLFCMLLIVYAVFISGVSLWSTNTLSLRSTMDYRATYLIHALSSSMILYIYISSQKFLLWENFANFATCSHWRNFIHKLPSFLRSSVYCMDVPPAPPRDYR